METKIIEILQREGKPIAPDVLLQELPDKDAAAAALERLLVEGRLLLTRKKKLALPEQTGLVYGRMQGHARGFGFFIPENGSPDAFIPADAMHGAMHNDKVWVRLTDQVSRNGTPEAEVALIAVRAFSRIVGKFESDRLLGGYVVPDETRIPMDVLIKDSDTGAAKPGDKVVVQIVQYPDGRRPMAGVVTEVLGGKNEAGTDILSIVRQYDLPEAFTKSALRQARTLKAPDGDAVARREDLRSLPIITIDGADAKDLDDAISLVPLGCDNMLLGVHIADVSAYVPEGSPLDKDAYTRGTSVYLLDRVLPMFPAELSNGVCSLHSGEDKLALSCIMEVTRDGRVVDHRFTESVIHTRHRMVYDDVNAMLNGNVDLRAKYADVLPMLERMQQLAERLHEKRVKRGSIDFDLAEAKITLDNLGRPTDIEAADRGVSHRMIEEFMLLANETVAQHLSDAGAPCMYRVHEKPDQEKLVDLNTFLQSLGYGVKNIKDVQPRTFQRILLSAKGTKEENIVNRVTLKSLKKARYSEQSLGHFGLAAQYYCHFTSPIRRYPDLVVHRILKALLHGALDAKQVDRIAAWLPESARHCSERERIAMEAERAVDDLKKCEYMQSRIGSVYSGLISGVINYGFFVELLNTVEGMVRLNSLEDDFYTHDEKNHRMIGRSSGRIYRLGDIVEVRVAGVDMDARTIDFELNKRAQKAANTPPEKPSPQKKDGSAPKAGGSKSNRSRGRRRSAKKTQQMQPEKR
ncbi:MAG: ribonuclease R [Bacillota bacterium]